SREWFVEDEQFWFVKHSGDELYLLLHALRQLLHLLVPPVDDSKLFEPVFKTPHGFGMTESLKLCEVECLFAHLHFPVQTAFLRQVADAVYIIGVYRASVQEYGAAVRRRD